MGVGGRLMCILLLGRGCGVMGRRMMMRRKGKRLM
jgi:hypothetical protein